MKEIFDSMDSMNPMDSIDSQRFRAFRKSCPRLARTNGSKTA
jgi:hypothetical protein